MDDESYEQWLNYYFYYCEKPELLGASNHLLFVAEKYIYVSLILNCLSGSPRHIYKERHLQFEIWQIARHGKKLGLYAHFVR